MHTPSQRACTLQPRCAGAPLPGGWGGELGADAAKEDPPLRLSQGRRVQLAVPTSVPSGLKTGMREECGRCLTLDPTHKVRRKHDFGFFFSFDILICVLFHLWLTGNMKTGNPEMSNELCVNLVTAWKVWFSCWYILQAHINMKETFTDYF